MVTTRAQKAFQVSDKILDEILGTSIALDSIISERCRIDVEEKLENIRCVAVRLRKAARDISQILDQSSNDYE